jgi:hypothetical protein
VTLQVIGAGWGRTGTLSFKQAIEQLGFGPCYHMLEVFGKSDHVARWEDAIAGRPVDWDVLLDGYRSTCDWPACTFWRELRAANPDAKVVLTRRDPDAWYRSFSKTILESLQRPVDPAIDPATGQDVDPVVLEHGRMTRALIFDRTLGGDLSREHTLAVLAAHEQDVIDTVPADALLVYDVAEGWDPLCAFLGVAVPDEPFPNTNTTADFRQMVGLDPPA